MFQNNQATMADVCAAYRVILSREIDEGALIAWEERIRVNPVSIDALREELLRSDEYVQRWGSYWTTVQLGDIKLVVDRREPEFGRLIADSEDWEPHIAALIRENLTLGSTFVDIGANVGVMSFQAAGVVGPSGKVIAFEPNSDNVQSFLRGLKINRFENVFLYPFGLSSSYELFSLQGNSNTFLSELSNDSVFTQCFIGDPLLENENDIDLIKIDIEGHEPFALKGLKNTIKKFRPRIICEFNPRCLLGHLGESPEKFALDLFSLCKRLEIIHQSETGLMRFDASDADHIIDTWHRLNDDAVKRNWLPDGMLHFDLLIHT